MIMMKKLIWRKKKNEHHWLNKEIKFLQYKLNIPNLVWPSEIPSEYILTANYQISRPKLLITIRNTRKFKWKYFSVTNGVWIVPVVRIDASNRWFGHLARTVSAARWNALSVLNVSIDCQRRPSVKTINTDRKYIPFMQQSRKKIARNLKRKKKYCK